MKGLRQNPQALAFRPMRLLFLFLALATTANADPRNVAGWQVHIRPALWVSLKPETEAALTLLQGQLEEIIRVVPAAAVAELQKVPLYFSPEYPGIIPRAEYHPSADWLRGNGRDPEMAKSVEFTNIRIYPLETKRMPNFPLHELAHAYHDRVLPGGYEHAEIKTAYEAAHAAGTYDRVQRRSASGELSLDKAYAMTNQQEYFAENTEAFFSTNDFFPFINAELKQHDPRMFAVLGQVWDLTVPAKITTPPVDMKLPAFYSKYLDAHGFPIISSAKVNDHALHECAYLIDLMLSKRPDVKAAMVKSGARMVVMAWNEFTTDIPEYAEFVPKDYWDARARGLGGSQTDPVCSCAEENVLAYPGDPYSTECIVIHEFAHNIHLRGMVNIDPTFDDRLKATYDAAMKAGLWKSKYASTNHHEYFAEGVQSWFDNNRENDSDHNHVNTRAELLEYDPGLAAICKEVFGDTELKYTKPTTRLHDHLADYDPSKAPTFVWPERLKTVKEEIKKEAANR